MAEAYGILTIVQEDRFLLADPQGTKHRFVLSHRARISGADLQALARAGTRVRVSFRSAPGILAHEASSVVAAGGVA